MSDAHLQPLLKRLDTLLVEQAKVVRALSEAQERYAIVTAQIDTLRSLYDEMKAVGGQDDNSGGQQPSDGERAAAYAARATKAIRNAAVHRQGPTDAVLTFLQSKPDGATKSEIVQSLEDRVETESDDPKRLLYNTLLNLRRRERIAEVRVNGEERYVLPRFLKVERVVEEDDF